MSLGPNVYDAEPIPEEARDIVEQLLKSGDLFRYTAPKDAPVTLLEQEFAEMLGAKYALAVASCSAALFLSLKALGLPRDARVLIPAFTFAAVPSAIVHADCKPVLVECGDNYRIDLDDFHAKIEEADAVMISHMRGHTSDMDAIKAACDAKGIPLIEDAAHSLGTVWDGQNIGTIGKIGCFSFQSYKLLNAGEGGIMITDDPEIMARAVIMSGAYEHNWGKHNPQRDNALAEAFGKWQNQLPLYNTRLSNMSATLVRPQLKEVPRRVADGRRNHDYTAARLESSPHLTVPAKLEKEVRAPDSLQFNLVDFSREEAIAFQAAAKTRGVSVQVFGLSTDNARAFWNWQFLGALPELPKTREMLSKACDTRLPARLTEADCDFIADALIAAAAEAKASKLAAE